MSLPTSPSPKPTMETKTPLPNPSTTITLLPATEIDLPALVKLQFQVYSTVLVDAIAFPDTPENQRTTLERHQEHMRDDPGMYTVKAVDTVSQNKIVGFCMFYVPTPSPDNPDEFVLPIPLRAPPSPSKQEDTVATTAAAPAPVSVPTPMPPAGEPPMSSPATASDALKNQGIALSRTNLNELRPERHRNVTQLISQSKVGRGAGYVRYMAVDQSYRRCGIGRRIMDWGTKLFDEHGVDVYLEATVEGAQLYKQYGFEEVSQQVFKVDGVERARYPCMWRPAGGVKTSGDSV